MEQFSLSIGIAGALFGIVFGGLGLFVTLLGWDGVIPTFRRWLDRRKHSEMAARRERVLKEVRRLLGAAGPGGPAGLPLHEFGTEDRPLVISLCGDGLPVLRDGTVYLPERAPLP